MYINSKEEIKINWDISKPLESATILVTYRTYEFIYDVICNLSSNKLIFKKLNHYRIKDPASDSHEFILSPDFFRKKIKDINVSEIKAALLEQFNICIQNEFDEVEEFNDFSQTKTKIVLLEELLLDVKYVMNNF